MAIILNPGRLDLTHTGDQVNAPSSVLYGTDKDPAHHPILDSAQALNKFYEDVAAAADHESADLDPFVRETYRSRVMVGRPFSGDLATLVRAGATLPAPDDLEERAGADEEALDRIAGILGRGENWYDPLTLLQAISDIITDTGRPSPGLNGSGYADAFLRETGRMLPNEGEL